MNYKLNIKGRYQDKLIWTSSITGMQRSETRLGKNQVQDSAIELISGLLTNSSSMTTPPIENLIGISYVALGSGDSSWDQDPSNVSKPTDQTTLQNETFRFQVSPDSFIFLDQSGAALSPQALSSRFKMSYTLGSADANGDLREFGLFGGAATSTLNSGTIFNWITHPLIQKDSSLTIQRTIDISLSIIRS